MYHCCLSNLSYKRESEQRLVTALFWSGSSESDDYPGLFIKIKLPYWLRKRCDLEIKDAICEQIAPMGTPGTPVIYYIQNGCNKN